MLRFVILICVIDFVQLEQKGDSCTVGVAGPNQNGICTYASECPIVAEWAKVLIFVHICTRENTIPVVCCPVNQIKSTTIKPTTSKPPTVTMDQITATNTQATGSDVRHSPMFHTTSTEPFREDDIDEPVSIRKCREYYQETRSTCGRAVPLIVGGTEANLGEFPHMAALGYEIDQKIKWRCGGAIISHRWVITAVHCVNKSPQPSVIRLGDLDLESDKDHAKPVDFEILRYKLHSDYLPLVKYNDIALLKTNRRITFNQFIRPACLWIQRTTIFSTAIAAGWGQTSFESELSPDLRKVQLDVISNDKCQTFWQTDQKGSVLPNGITSNLLCTLTRNKDTCFGDSGSPLVIVDENNYCTFNIIGITSFGRSCGGPNSPGVYTRVSSYIDWIESVVWP